MLLRCAEAKLRFHAIGSKAPWRLAIEKLNESELAAYLGPKTDEQIDELLRGVMASFTMDEMLSVETHGPRSAARGVAVIFAQHEWRKRYTIPLTAAELAALEAADA